MIEIRRLDKPDPKHIFPLINQLGHELSYEGFCRYLEDMLAKHYFIVAAYDGEQLVGLTGCWVASKFYCGKYLELDNFVVDQACRGQGVGGKLMDYTIQLAKDLGCESVMLDAYVGNHAHRLYDRYQFEKPGIHRVLPLNDAVAKRIDYKARQQS